MLDVSTTKIEPGALAALEVSYNLVGFPKRRMPVPDGALVGGLILDHLKRREWSLGMLADRSGLNKGYLSQLTRGRVKNPGAQTLGKISDALRVPLSEITGESPMQLRRVEIFEGVARVPVMQVRVQASGRPTWGDSSERLPVPLDVAAGRPNVRAAVVTGHCMEPRVSAGDRVVFDPDATPQNAQMVIVTTEDGATLVKWYRIDPLGRPYLRAADGTEVRPNGAKVEGVVLYVSRRAPRDPEA